MTVEQVEKLRDRLVSQFFFSRYRVTCDAEVLQAWATELAKMLRVHTSVVFDSLFHLAGRPLTEDEARKLAWRLAGGLELLKAGKAVPPWSQQFSQEEVLVTLLEYSRHMDSRQRPLACFRALVHTGSPAGLEAVCSWPMSLVTSIARRAGFTRHFGAYPLRHVSELVGLRLAVVLEPRNGEARPYFSRIVEKQSLVTWNRKHVMTYRVRKTPCPQRFTHYCHECGIGRDTCPGATHPHLIQVTYDAGATPADSAEQQPA